MLLVIFFSLGVEKGKISRVVFNAITKSAIENAFANPGKIDIDKVMAQQARRILDRIVGYQISPLLWKKVARGLSAGRVQSVAVKIVVERERQIRAFEPVEFWLLPAVFTKDVGSDYSKKWLEFITPKNENNKPPTVAEQNKWLAEHNSFKAELISVGDEKFSADSKQQAEDIFDAIKGAQFAICDKQTKRAQSRAAGPFITSTLQQSAAGKLGYSAKRTMRTAQQLYEGVELGQAGAVGLITYMRTDSMHISKEAIAGVRDYVGAKFGADYLPAKPNYFASNKAAQEAHEAIRPTDVSVEPQQIQPFVSAEQFKLYQLIWNRFVASQMSAAQWDTTILQVKADTAKGACVYRASGKVMVFDGFMKVWQTGLNDQQLPDLAVGDTVGAVDIKAEQHFTKGPARYSEGSLVKQLEKEGIGRPSTYASIISTIQDRGYVEQIDRKFYATDIGEAVTDKLNEFFPKVMDTAFTRHMEAQLDKIESEHIDWITVLNEFYGPFKQNLDNAAEQMKHLKAETQPSEYKCPDCGKELVYKFSKNGRFLSCSAYPECKFASPCDREGKIIKDETTEIECPNCKKMMVKKRGRFGEFLGCSDYPDCKTILKLDKQGNVMPPKAPAEPSGVKCHKCKEGELVIRQSKRGPFLGCGRFPRCRNIISIKMVDKLKELQEAGKWPPQSIEQADEILGRKKPAKKKT